MCQPTLRGRLCLESTTIICQILHKAFAIAIERLYLHKTCTTDVPKELLVACVTHYEGFGKIRSLEFVKKYLTDYQSVKDNAKKCIIRFFIRNSIFHLNPRLLKKDFNFRGQSC